MNIVEMLDAHSDEIVDKWMERVQRAASAQGLTCEEVVDTLAEYLRSLVRALAGSADPNSDVALERSRELHVATRLRQGFNLDEVVLEYSWLVECVSETWMALDPAERPHPDEVQRFSSTLNRSIGFAVATFTQHLAADEQTEKRLLRLLETIATDEASVGLRSFRDRLEQLVEVVRSGMDADTAALFLYDAAGNKLTMAASVGIGDERAGEYTTLLGSTSFVARVAAIDETTVFAEQFTRDVEVTEALRRSRVETLLGCPLRFRGRLVGVMYVGVGERRAFTAFERRRMHTLAQRLAFLLDHTRLLREREDSIGRLEAERELRVRFVSVLVHDLRGPLSAARMAAQAIAQHPRPFEQQRDLATKVDRNIVRTDRMIQDLLDANRIRAGERLALRLEECDLAGVAREMVLELESIHGHRFVLVAEPIRGIWSCDELRRALWNLATNAVKYGLPDAPVDITIKRVGELAYVSVHNEGCALPADERERLFEPFSRTRHAESSSPRGWGLGLTLVRGCVEAHGGSIEIESAPGHGTTFILRLPLDARIFQPKAEPAPAPPP